MYIHFFLVLKAASFPFIVTVCTDGVTASLRRRSGAKWR